jgi:23S rRNA (cytidine1920-2'-O)/16S rRNA (cytidine1409-2'-O)-methyltransferase
VRSVEASGGAEFEAVVLVKPQFEAGREQVEKGGLVRNPEAHAEAVAKVRSAMSDLGFTDLGVTESPILGGEGNREFLLYGRRSGRKPTR